MRLLQRLVLTGIFLGSAVPGGVARRAAAESAPRWVEVKTEHFVVLSDAGEGRARHTAVQFEQMRALFVKLFPRSRAADPTPLTVLALKDRKSMDAVVPAAYLAKGQLQLAGLFLHGPESSYILARTDAEGENPFSTVYHEYTHYLTAKIEAIPLWLNEGMAQFYQETQIESKYALVGKPSEQNILYLREKKLMPLRTLLSVDYNSPYYHEEEKGSVFYAESWALTHMIMVSDRAENVHKLQDYLDAIQHGKDPVAAAEAIFGDLTQLQRKLSDYIDHNAFKMFQVNAAVTLEENSIHATPVPATTADAVRADVLAHERRDDDAKKLAEAVIAADPQNPLPHETLGMLAGQQGDFVQARKQYAEAVRLKSPNHGAYFRFATLAMESGAGDDATIEASLKKSIELDPSFAPAYDALAQFYGSRHRNFDEARMASLKAVQMDPNNVAFRVNSAQLWAAQGNYDSAITVLQAAQRVARTDDDRHLVALRLLQMKNMVEARNAHAAPPAAPTQTVTEQHVDTLLGADGKVRRVVTGNTTVNGVAVADPANAGAQPEPAPFPDAAPKAVRHVALGTVQTVTCSYPTVLTMTLAQPGGKSTVVYSNNFYKLEFRLTNFVPKGDLKPCSEIQGMKAKVEYAEVADKRVAGQIVSVQLTK